MEAPTGSGTQCRTALVERRCSRRRCVRGWAKVHRHARSTMAATLPKLLDINGVAQHLGVNVRHVRRLVAERRIPFIKWGHLLRFDPDRRRGLARGRAVSRRRADARRFTVTGPRRTIAIALGASPFTRPRELARIGGRSHDSTTPIRIGPTPSVGTVASALLGRGGQPHRCADDVRYQGRRSAVARRRPRRHEPRRLADPRLGDVPFQSGPPVDGHEGAKHRTRHARISTGTCCASTSCPLRRDGRRSDHRRRGTERGSPTFIAAS